MGLHRRSVVPVVAAVLGGALALALSGCVLLIRPDPTDPASAGSSQVPGQASPAATPTSSQDAVASEPAATSSAAGTSASETVDMLPAGSCFSWLVMKGPDTVAQVPCDQVHDGQVVAQAVFGGTATPKDGGSDDDLNRIFDEQCVPAFKELTGTAYDNSRLSMNLLGPSEEAFAAENRSATCILEMYDFTPYAGSAVGKRDESQFTDHSADWQAPTEQELGVGGGSSSQDSSHA